MGQQHSALISKELKDLEGIDYDAVVQFTINNVLYKVNKDMPSSNTLNTFIRETAKLKGTKVSCHEGGCGVCIVAAEVNGCIMSVNSCLVPVLICDGWKITTIEGLGDRIKGYHTLQASLAEMNGSQCGFCSSGWIMNMYSLSSNGKMTMKEIENSFASNLCRCTGYRPILDTFKSFASDSPPVMKEQIKDIEELYDIKRCENCPKKLCNGGCKDLEIVTRSSFSKSLGGAMSDNTFFFKIIDVNNIFTLYEFMGDKVRFIFNGGNTSHGVYRRWETQVRCDINSVEELHRVEKTQDSLTLGANTTLTMAKMTFEKYANDPGFEYLKRLAKHIDMVASIPIRNIGTIAGNLMIKHEHREFPSDIFLILETAGAELHILDGPGSKFSKTLMEFLDFDMDRKLIYSVVLPARSKEYIFKSYKIMPRAQNAHAIVNAGFLFKLDNSGKLLEKPNIIFGGIRPDFFHAVKTEEFLNGNMINDSKTVQKAIATLYSELNPDYVLPDYKPEYRKLLASSLLYKFILNLNSNKLNPKFKSGGFLIPRDVSSGKQTYDTDESLYPLNQPVTKIEAIYQTSGEAEYINDIIIRDNEVFCALCLAGAPGPFEKIDASEAMEVPGFVTLFTAEDIPGKNAFISNDDKHFTVGMDEILLADKEIIYAGQPYAIVVATSLDNARLASMKVKLIYPQGPIRKPMITVQDVLASNDKARLIPILHLPMQGTPGTDVKHKIKGNMSCGAQYHFCMEKQTCVCVPIENGMEVYSSTQWMDLTQVNVANCLGVPTSSINVQVRRLGGGLGAKISRATQTACMCALVCHKLRRPARMVMSIEDNMRCVGKRPSSYLEYDVSVNDMGKIQKLEAQYYANAGHTFNDTNSLQGCAYFHNCYDMSTWDVSGTDALTDLPSNTYCRAPGSPESINMCETMMERIARITGKDPIDVRLINMTEDDRKIAEPMWNDLKKTSDYDKRLKDVNKFNNENRWRKRGISAVFMNFNLEIWGQFHALVSIFARDGTVAICHGGIEMGQGLNTKLAQVAARTFGIDLNKIVIKPGTSWSSPNDYTTGGAHASDTVGYAVLKACTELMRRLEPIREMLGGDPTWEELTLTAHHKDVNLCASDMYKMGEQIAAYPIWGMAVCEVEVDMLTGAHITRRVDIVEDTGISLSPKIDVGQVEGAFVMGAGFWTTEDLLYDTETGALTNYRTWNYKIPGAKDIPVDFRVHLHQKLPNPLGIVRSKSTGESPLCLSCGIPIAIRNAINSARADAGNKDVWYQLDYVLSPESILLNSLTNVNDMVL